MHLPSLSSNPRNLFNLLLYLLSLHLFFFRHLLWHLHLNFLLYLGRCLFNWNICLIKLIHQNWMKNTIFFLKLAISASRYFFFLARILSLWAFNRLFLSANDSPLAYLTGAFIVLGLFASIYFIYSNLFYTCIFYFYKYVIF